MGASGGINPVETLKQMLVIMLIIAAGYLARKKKIISESSLKDLSKIAADILNPAIIFSSMISNTGGKRPEFVGGIFIVAAVMFAVAIAAGWLFGRILSRDRAARAVYQMMIIFSNMGFIGIPVISSLLGREYVFYVAVYIFEYNLLFYTLGIHILDSCCGERSSAGEPAREKGTGKSLFQKLKPMFNMGTLACAAALLVFISRIQVPDVIGSAVSYLGDGVIPISLLIIGADIAGQKDLGQIFKKKENYFFLLLKMFALPILCTFILKFIPMPEKVRQLSMLMMAMPVGTMNLIMIKERGIESRECSDCTILSTIASVITLPAMAAIYQMII